MFLESLSLASVIPAITALISDENPFAYINIDLISNLTSRFNKIDLTEIVLFGLVIIYFLKTLYMIFLTYGQNRFIYNLYASFSKQLLQYYLEESYAFHLKNNSSKMVKNFLREISNLVALTKSLITLTTEIFLFSSIVLTVIVLDPISAFIIGGTMFVVFITFSLVTKKRINFYSEKREYLDTKISKIVTESLNGIKEIKINNLKNFFLKSFNGYQNLNSLYARNYHTILSIPKFLFEFTALLSLIVFIMINLYMNVNINAILTSTGLFVIAAFKIVPSLNKILNGFQTVRYYKNSLDIFYKYLVNTKILDESSIEKNINFSKEIEFKKLSFSYNKSQKKILYNINLILKANTIIGIMGDSGTGKSTFVDILSGLLLPTDGFFAVDNIDINSYNIASWKKSIGYVPQNVYLVDDTLKNNIAFGINEELIDERRVENCIKITGLENFVKNKKEGLNYFVGEFGSRLSGGQRQRVGIARALYREPKLLILDESTASLDKTTEKKIFDTLLTLKKKVTIIVISHDLNNFSICDKVLKIENGNLKELKLKYEL